jgi:hypothetical protein
MIMISVKLLTISQAPFVPSCMPNLKQEWHTAPLPMPEDVPGLECAEPVQHCQWDARFMREKDEARGERKKVDSWLRKQNMFGRPPIVKPRLGSSMQVNDGHGSDSDGQSSGPGSKVSKHSTHEVLSEKTRAVVEVRMRS